MTSPTLPITELPTSAQAARLEAEHLWAYTNRLNPWTATRLNDGTISLSAQIRDRAGTLVLAEFASRACTYFEGRPGTPGDQFPALDVSLPGREAYRRGVGGAVARRARYGLYAACTACTGLVVLAVPAAASRGTPARRTPTQDPHRLTVPAPYPQENP